MSHSSNCEFVRLSAVVQPDCKLHALLYGEDGAHAQRVADLCFALAVTLGQGDDWAKRIAAAALWHDVGKSVVDPQVLNKPGALTAQEKQLVDRHVWHGYSILQSNSLTEREAAASIALLHHERFDGGGHPFGLRAEAIPLMARIASVADVYDALLSARPYKPAWARHEALGYLDAERGKHFDPGCVDALFALLEVTETERSLRRGLSRLNQLRERLARFGARTGMARNVCITGKRPSAA